MTPESKTKTRKARARAETPGTNGTATAGARKREQLAQDLAAELKALRTALDEMTEQYRLRAAAQIRELLELAEGQTVLDKPAARLAGSITQPMLDRLHEGRLKPGKGRGKDFVRMQELLDDLVALLPPER